MYIGRRICSFISIRFILRSAGTVAVILFVASAVKTRGTQSTPTSPSPQAVTLGIVMPRAQSRVEISGSVTTDPDSLKDIPGVIVVKVPVTVDSSDARSSAKAALLERLYIDVGDGNRQRADGPIVVKHDSDASHTAFKVFSSIAAAQPIAETEMPVYQSPPVVISPRYMTSPAYDPMSIQVLHGPTGGDSRKMRVEMGGQPCPIVSAQPGVVLFRPSTNMGTGEDNVVFHEGESGASFSVPKVLLGLSAGQLNLLKGQSTDMDLTVSLSGASRSSWKPGLPPRELVDLNVLRRDYPELPQAPPQGGGEMVVALRNATPHIIRAHNMGGNERMWHLQQAALPLHYRDVLTAHVAGAFNVQVVVVLYAAEIEGRPLGSQESTEAEGR